jgi:hypothetical protein
LTRCLPIFPKFIAQGDTDAVVRPAVTQAYMTRLCPAGSRVTFLELPGVGHGAAALKSALPAVAWRADRFAHRSPPDNRDAH